MAFLAWIVVGLLAGFLAGKVENMRVQGIALDLPLGIVGAVVGGLIYNRSGVPGVQTLNLYSLLVALVGSAFVLAVYHVMFRRV